MTRFSNASMAPQFLITRRGLHGPFALAFTSPPPRQINYQRPTLSRTGELFRALWFMPWVIESGQKSLIAGDLIVRFKEPAAPWQKELREITAKQFKQGWEEEARAAAVLTILLHAAEIEKEGGGLATTDEVFTALLANEDAMHYFEAIGLMQVKAAVNRRVDEEIKAEERAHGLGPFSLNAYCLTTEQLINLELFARSRARIEKQRTDRPAYAAALSGRVIREELEGIVSPSGQAMLRVILSPEDPRSWSLLAQTVAEETTVSLMTIGDPSAGIGMVIPASNGGLEDASRYLKVARSLSADQTRPDREVERLGRMVSRGMMAVGDRFKLGLA